MVCGRVQALVAGAYITEIPRRVLPLFQSVCYRDFQAYITEIPMPPASEEMLLYITDIPMYISEILCIQDIMYTRYYAYY